MPVPILWMQSWEQFFLARAKAIISCHTPGSGGPSFPTAVTAPPSTPICYPGEQRVGQPGAPTSPEDEKQASSVKDTSLQGNDWDGGTFPKALLNLFCRGWSELRNQIAVSLTSCQMPRVRTSACCGGE